MLLTEGKRDKTGTFFYSELELQNVKVKWKTKRNLNMIFKLGIILRIQESLAEVMPPMAKLWFSLMDGLTFSKL